MRNFAVHPQTARSGRRRSCLAKHNAGSGYFFNVLHQDAICACKRPAGYIRAVCNGYAAKFHRVSGPHSPQVAGYLNITNAHLTVKRSCCLCRYGCRQRVVRV